LEVGRCADRDRMKRRMGSFQLKYGEIVTRRGANDSNINGLSRWKVCGKLVCSLDDVVIGDHMPGGISNDSRSRLNVVFLRLYEGALRVHPCENRDDRRGNCSKKFGRAAFPLGEIGTRCDRPRQFRREPPSDGIGLRHNGSRHREEPNDYNSNKSVRHGTARA
jgi:hypothetical protein